MLAGCAGADPAGPLPVAARDFTSTTVDIGIVVSDIDKSVAFYKDALGFKEIGGFKVPANLGGDAGLSDYKPFQVHVLVLGEGPTATKVKLMQFPDAPGAKPNNEFIHSSVGMRYLTLPVANTEAAVARAAKAGVKPIAKGPVPLPEGFPKGVYLTCVRDPDGNLIEFVGPNKE